MASKYMAAKLTKKNNQRIGYIVVLSVIAITLGAIVYVYTAQKLVVTPDQTAQPVDEQPDTIHTPTPTPTKLFHGKDTYYLSGGAMDDPHFPQVDIDPLDPEVQGTQAFTVHITSTYPVNEAFLNIRTDIHTTKVPLNLDSGTRTDGYWKATWTLPETYLYNYKITLTAQTSYTQGTATITIRHRE